MTPVAVGRRSLRLSVFGAAPDSGNLGVQALYGAIVAALARHAPGSTVSVFDNGWGVREVPHDRGDLLLEHCGVRRSRRWHRPESWVNVRASVFIGGLGNPIATRLRASDAIMDISGGDSFSDIYGVQRFHATAAPKRAAVALRCPLVLLPQTYGPFRSPRIRATASRLVRAATLAYSRDEASHEQLLDLLGADADVGRHRLGVDMAFALERRDPGPRLPADIRTELLPDVSPCPRVGINVSGLIFNDPTARDRFGLTLNYGMTVRRLVTWLARQDCHVFLVPHVAPRSTCESNTHDDDVRACRNIEANLPPRDRGKVMVVPSGLDADEIKWVIGRMDWFCGTRMHSTIAGLSSAVPTVAIAYSMKTRGVFDSCGQGDEVIEARQVGDDECLRRVQDSWERRDLVRASLATRVAAVRRQASDQMVHAVQELTAQAGGGAQ